MPAGTVISGGFPGRVAQEVQPNQKCEGCLHYDRQGGRTGACTIGTRPWLCGDGGSMQDIGYAPLVRGAGAYLPDMNNHAVQAPEVEPQASSDLHGVGSTRPVEVRQVSLGEEHVHLVKSLVTRHAELQKSQCRLCSMRGTHGVAPPNVGFQLCTCAPLAAETVAKAVVSRMSNAQRVGVSVADVADWVRGVVKAGFHVPPPDKARSLGGRTVHRNRGKDHRGPNRSLSDQVQIDGNGGHLRQVEKASFYHPHGEYRVSPAGGGQHHIDFHPKDGGSATRLPGGPFPSPKAARRALTMHASRIASGSGKNTPSTSAPTRNMKVGSDSDSMSKSLYSEDWINQFRGTPLFDEARKLCERELKAQEDDLRRREERIARDKKVKEAARAVPDTWEDQDVRREKIRIAKQRLTLKLAAHHQGAAGR